MRRCLRKVRFIFPQWTNGEFAGFVNESTIGDDYEPWLPVNPDKVNRI